MTSIKREYNGIIDWNMAGLFTYDFFWIPYFQKLYDNNIEIPIDYIYGTPLNTGMGGGRNPIISESELSFSSSVTNILQDYIDLNVGCRLPFSNHMLTETQYQDEFVNELLNYLNTHGQKNGIILTDDNFNEYIKNKYNNLQRICSVIRPAIDLGWGKEDAKYYNDLAKKYDLVVLNCGFAKNLDNLKDLEQKEKFEIIVNSRCTLNCKFAKQHYDIVAQCNFKDLSIEQCQELQTKEIALMDRCNNIKNQRFLEGSNFTIDEIQKLIDNGIHHFKLEGRNWPCPVIARDMGYYVCDPVLSARLYEKTMGVVI